MLDVPIAIGTYDTEHGIRRRSSVSTHSAVTSECAAAFVERRNGFGRPALQDRLRTEGAASHDGFLEQDQLHALIWIHGTRRIPG
jgi:hypothetical protein